MSQQDHLYQRQALTPPPSSALIGRLVKQRWRRGLLKLLCETEEPETLALFLFPTSAPCALIKPTGVLMIRLLTMAAALISTGLAVAQSLPRFGTARFGDAVFGQASSGADD